jgi:anthranilate phosphoribosyltransferase
MQIFLKIVGNGQRTARDLTSDEAETAMALILEGRATPAQIGAFMAALRIKEESADELAAFTRILRRYAEQVVVNEPTLVDICVPYDGRAKSPSLIVGAALIAAAAGAKIALHGRPGQSTPPKFGVTVGDILSRLGVATDLALRVSAQLLKDEAIGLAFAASETFCPALEQFNSIRHEYGMRSFFNTIEKLLNPFGASKAIVGVFHGPVLARVAGAMQAQGYARGIAVQGPEGSIEVLCNRRTPLYEFNDAQPVPCTWSIDPTEFNWWERAEGDSAQNLTAQANADLTRRLITAQAGEEDALQRGTLMTAALMLYGSGKAGTFRDGLAAAQESLRSGAAAERLLHWQTAVSQAI